MNKNQTTVVHNLRIIDKKEDRKKLKCIMLIVLNRPVIPEQLKQLLSVSDCVICADGGANHIYDVEGKEYLY